MKRKAQQPKTLQDAIRHFSDEQTCIDAVAALRWPDGPQCPACEGREHYYLATQKRWKCKECGRQFSVKLGTIFEDSPIALDKWLTALWMLVNCKNGISSYEVAATLGITQKSAWFVMHRLRLALRDGSIEKLGGSGGPVEMDETFVGGKPQNMHKARRLAIKYIRDDSGVYPNKTAVFGMLDRDSRKVRASVVGNVKREALQDQILKHVTRGATLHTDQASAYWCIARDNAYVHEIVNHANEYVRGQVHTNGIENFWSLLKRGLRGTYVAVEPFHLDRYIDEQVFRFNHRKDALGNKLTSADRFNAALSQVAGKRLTFAEVTGKTGSEAIF